MKKWIKNHKIIFILISIFISILLIAFGAKFWLYIHFLLGNDIVVKLDVDKRDIILEHGQKENITFTAKATTNPFCTAVCKSTFIDISRDAVIGKDDFKLRPGSPLQKNYIISSRDISTGLDLYRFDLDCHSVSTLLCHTKEEPSTRSILITLYNELTEEESVLKDSSKKKVEKLLDKLSILQGNQVVFENVAEELNTNLIFDDESVQTGELLNLINKELNDIKEIWEKQDYPSLSKSVDYLDSKIIQAEQVTDNFYKDLTEIVFIYNEIINNLDKTKNNLELLKSTALTNNITINKINNLIDEFNESLNLIKKKSNIYEKESVQHDIKEKTENLLNEMQEELKKEDLEKEIGLDINYDILCDLTENCIQHPSVEEHANQTEFDLKIVCSKIDILTNELSEINESIKEGFNKQNYPETNDFWNNISAQLGNMGENIKKAYLEKLPENSINNPVITEFLRPSAVYELEEYGAYNLTPALISELVKQPESCVFPNITLNQISDINLKLIELPVAVPVTTDISFGDPSPMCCVFGSCNDCCYEDCRNDPQNFPVVFLHGHAINKDSSAEYSLEGWNKIQKKLEEDGYLNAGAVTLFSTTDSPEGVWGLPPVPLTIRTSYYFDIFRQPDNYISVQAKSENIDTYAIRLKELIDTVKYKTGRPKVKIIAFSMGGLVARRYIQIFGTDSTYSLTMVGTPNKGIVGNIADYCPITGEKLECRDMNSESLFINKLNSGKLPDISIYNIVGTGCKMGKYIGDGAVLEEKAFFEGANNYIIEGTCSKTVPLHLKLRDIDIYPEVYDIIRDSLG